VLTDVYPDGRSILVTEGARRLTLRSGYTKPEIVNPGEICPVTIDLTNTAMTFVKGHRLRILVSSSNYPHFDVDHKRGVTLNRLYADAAHASSLILPVEAR
jgi:putative CocE/NonD family hydrolase